MAEIWGDSVDKKLHEGGWMDGWWMDGWMVDGWLVFVKFKDRSEPINLDLLKEIKVSNEGLM